MAHNLPKTVKAVMVSVTYHRNCFVIVDDEEDIEDAVREQVRMPNDPMLDPSEWSEDEFAVIECPLESFTLETRTIKKVK